MFKNPFSFSGRIRRKEYGISLIIFYIFLLFVLYLDYAKLDDPLLGYLTLPAYWFLLSQGTKRCHDRGNIGLFQIIPFYGFVMLFAEGDIGENKYGEDPKAINNKEFDGNI